MTNQDSGGMWLFGGPPSNQSIRKPDSPQAAPPAVPPAIPEASSETVAGPPEGGARPPAPQPPSPPAPVAEPAQPSAARATDADLDSTVVRDASQPVWSSSPAPPGRPPESVDSGPPSRSTEPTDSSPDRIGRRGIAPLAVIAMVVVAVILGGGVAWFTLRDDQVTPAVAPAPSSVVEPTDSGVTDPPFDSPSETPTSASPTDMPTPTETPQDDELSEKDARKRLNALADDGLDEVSLDGQPVAMIASKWDGVDDPLQETADGHHRFHYVDILAEHNRLAAQDNLGARVVMLRGSDYGRHATSPDGKEIYVTLALGNFDSQSEVRAWCNERFADLSRKKRDNQCVATKLTE